MLFCDSLVEQNLFFYSYVLAVLWCTKIPNRIAFLVWRSLKNRLPTKDNLLKRDVIDVNSDQTCVLCNNYIESALHLFLPCEVVTNLWLSPSFSVALHENLEGHFWQFVGIESFMILFITSPGLECIVWRRICDWLLMR